MSELTNISENLTQYLTNSLNITSVYYNMFFNTTPMDIELELYDNSGVLQKYTIPNRAKDRALAYEGSGLPTDTEAPVGSIYIDTTSNSVYVKTNSGWSYVLKEADIVSHNTSQEAHLGQLARIGGDSSIQFNVAQPTADNSAVNRRYVGNLSDLNTSNKLDVVSSINEVLVASSGGYTRLALLRGNIDPSTNLPDVAYVKSPEEKSVISFKSGGVYPVLSCIDANGTVFEREYGEAPDSLVDIDTSELVAGNYQLFIPKEGDPYLSNVDIIISSSRPDTSTTVRDILWQNNDQIPFVREYYYVEENAWSTIFDDVLLCRVLVSSGEVSEIEHYPYGFNYFTINNNAAGDVLFSEMYRRLPLSSISKLSNFEELSIGVSGTEYTAPANGRYDIVKRSTGSNQYLGLIRGYLDDSNSFVLVTEDLRWSSTSNQSHTSSIDVLKGDVVKISYSMPTNIRFRFFYSEEEAI